LTHQILKIKEQFLPELLNFEPGTHALGYGLPPTPQWRIGHCLKFFQVWGILQFALMFYLFPGSKKEHWLIETSNSFQATFTTQRFVMGIHPQILGLGLSALVGLSIAPASQAQTIALDAWVSQVSEPTAAGEEQLVHSEMGRFSVQLPVKLDATTATTEISGDTLTWTVSTASQGDTLYAVAYTDLPLEILALGQEAVIASLEARPFLQEFDWQTLSNRGQRVTLGDIPGIEFLELNAGQVSAARFYLANRRLYAVMASSSDLHEVSRFLDSFAIDSLWRPFVSEAGGFTVDLPMAPVFTPQQVDYQGSTLDWWQFVGYNLYAPDDRYGFAYADLPDGLTIDNADALLADVATRVLAELNAPNLATTGTSISLEGMPGREYVLTKPNGQSYVLRLFLADQRLYGLLATSASLDNLDRFLSSFQVQD
jgi:hypothetical protein